MWTMLIRSGAGQREDYQSWTITKRGLGINSMRTRLGHMPLVRSLSCTYSALKKTSNLTACRYVCEVA